MLRRILDVIGAELLLALAGGWAVFEVGLLSAGGAVSLAAVLLPLLAAIGVGLLILAVPVVALLERQPRLVVNAVPGLASTQPRPPARLLRIGAGAVLLLVVTSLGLGWPALALVLLALADATVAFILTRLRAELHRRDERRDKLTAALTAFAPEFVVYTARRNDASYQLAMWLPQLEKLDRPFLVVVRHVDAIGHARGLTGAPVVCCPTAADLDALLVPSLRAAFYVNGVSENTNFVLYRQLQHIYLGHGDSDKEMSVHPMHAMFDQIFVAGRAAIERYAEVGLHIDPAKFRIVGRPQLAELSPGTSRPTTSGGRRRVLVAPTWRGYNAASSLSSLPATPAVVGTLLAAGAEVSFRPHPFSWLGTEQEQIAAVDAVLRADRSATGRSHRLAEENRSATLAQNFADSDAMVTDVGSVLVDYFAADKPYAVVLPPGLAPSRAAERYPSTAAAYLVSADAGPGEWVQNLLVTDPLAARRASVRQRYLGDQPCDDRPFLDAVRDVLAAPSTDPAERLSVVAPSPLAGTASAGQGGEQPAGAGTEPESFGQLGEDPWVGRGRGESQVRG